MGCEVSASRSWEKEVGGSCKALIQGLAMGGAGWQSLSCPVALCCAPWGQQIALRPPRSLGPRANQLAQIDPRLKLKLLDPAQWLAPGRPGVSWAWGITVAWPREEAPVICWSATRPGPIGFRAYGCRRRELRGEHEHCHIQQRLHMARAYGLKF